MEMRIKELRVERNLTQSEVAKAIGTSQRNIGRWENGENTPAAIYVKALAEFFCVSTDYLLGLEDDFGVKIAGTGNSDTPATAEERKLLADYRAVPEELRALIREQMALFTKAEGIFTEKK